MEQADPLANIKVELDRCVKCGMCLPECPTYRLRADENESPRGRLALIEGWVDGRLSADDKLLAHLDRCLTCRRCERVCPSQVPYGNIIDQARANMPHHSSSGLLDSLIHQPAYLRLSTRLASYIPPAITQPLGGFHVMHQLAHALPMAEPPAPGEYPALTKQQRGRLGLFLGCATAVQQAGALNAALDVLRKTGFSVSIPRTAGCCGAMAQHKGDSVTANRLADVNHGAFDTALDAVVSIASGCGTHLDSVDPPLPAPHRDVCDFLLAQSDLSPKYFRPLQRTVLLHTPCTVENLYRGGHWAKELLEMIPRLTIEPIGEPGQCCGSAGDYMLRQRDIAVRLRQPILDGVSASDSRILLTSNIGCALHLAQGLMEQGSDVEVLHPIELLHRQLRS